jgi:hypothetical protein
MMKVSKIIKENNQLKTGFSPENKKFYEDLLVLVRVKSLFRKEEIYEESLLAIEYDLLEAQAAGQSAESYLGRDIGKLANEIIAETPKENRLRILQLCCLWLGIYLISSLIIPTMISLLITHSATISLGQLLFGILYSLVIFWGLLKSFTISSWVVKIINRGYFWLWIRGLLPALLVFSGWLLIAWLTRNIWVVTFS